MDSVLNKQHNSIRLHPSDLNTHFTILASCLTHKDNESHNFTDFFNSILEETGPETFKIKHTDYNEVRKKMKKKKKWNKRKTAQRLMTASLLAI